MSDRETGKLEYAGSVVSADYADEEEPWAREIPGQAGQQVQSIWSVLEQSFRPEWVETGNLAQVFSRLSEILEGSLGASAYRLWMSDRPGCGISEYLRVPDAVRPDSSEDYNDPLAVETSSDSKPGKQSFELVSCGLRVTDAEVLLQVMRRHRTVGVGELGRAGKPWQAYLEIASEQADSWLFAPLRRLGRVVGICGARMPDYWTPEERGFFSMTVDLLSATVSTAALKDSRALESARASMLRQFYQDHSLPRLISRIEKVLGFNSRGFNSKGSNLRNLCYVYHLANKGDGLVLVSAEDSEDLMKLAPSGNELFVPRVVNEALKQYSPIEIEEIASSRLCKDLQSRSLSAKGEPVTSGLFYPLSFREGRAQGVVAIFSRETISSLSSADLERVTLCVEVLSTALDQLAIEMIKEEAREAALNASAMKTKFLATMNHEMRTPLAAMIGYIEAINAGDVSVRDLNPALEKIERNGRHLMSLLNDLLDLSRVEAGLMQIELQYVNPESLVNEVIETLMPLAKRNSVTVGMEVRGEKDRTVLTDPLRFKQIVFNLAGNALKFARPGHVISRENAGVGKDHPALSKPDVLLGLTVDSVRGLVVLDVEDNGPGMPADQLEEIFKPFRQLYGNSTAKTTGSGLGLAISKDLVSLLGGDITVESELGRGSVFRVCLRCSVKSISEDRGSEEQKALRPVEAQAGMFNPSRCGVGLENKLTCGLEQADDQEALVSRDSKYASARILLADDSEDNLELTTLFLDRLGVAVDTVMDGNSAVARALDGNYDLVLMDMEMPVMNGLEACKFLRRNGYKVPIVAITAHCSDSKHQDALSSGCNGVLQKPFSRSEIVKLLDSYLFCPEEEEKKALEPTPILSDLEVLSHEMLEVLHKFVNNLPSRASSLETALHSGDWSQVGMLAHQLAGVGSAYGYPQLTKVSRNLEHEVHAGRLDSAEGFIKGVLHTIDRIVAAKNLPGGLLMEPRLDSEQTDAVQQKK